MDLADISNLEERRDIGSLINALKHNNQDIRGEAAKALGKIGDNRAVEPLCDALKDGDREVRSSAAEALDKLNWQSKNDSDRIYYLLAKLNWEELVEIGKPSVAPLCYPVKL